MDEITELSAAVFDTTVIVKGIVPPRRQKNDELLNQQVEIHRLARTFMDAVESGKTELNLPSIALVETAAVVSRLTNHNGAAEESVDLLRAISTRILSDNEFLEEAIKVGIETKASGFDVVFLACSKILRVPLVTDDKQLADTAKRYGYTYIYLRDLLKS